MKIPIATNRGRLALLGLALLSACRDSVDEGQDVLSVAPVAAQGVLSGRVLWNGPALGSGRTMAVNGDHLFVADRLGDPFIHVMRVSDGRVVRSYGLRGEGPGDFTGVMSLSTRFERLWAFDLGLRRLTELSPTQPPEITRTVHAPEAVIPMDMVWLGANRMVIVGALDTNRFILADSTGHELHRINGELLGADTIPLPLRISLSTGFNICASSQAARFALVFVGAGRIDIHDTNARLVARAQVPRPTNGEFVIDSTGRLRAKTNARHYEACSATPRRIYALYSGWEIVRPEDRGRVQATIIEAYSWSGVLERSWQLDRSVGAIAVVGDSTLYAASADDEGILQYDLN